MTYNTNSIGLYPHHSSAQYIWNGTGVILDPTMQYQRKVEIPCEMELTYCVQRLQFVEECSTLTKLPQFEVLFKYFFQLIFT